MLAAIASIAIAIAIAKNICSHKGAITVLLLRSLYFRGGFRNPRLSVTKDLPRLLVIGAVIVTVVR